MRATQLQIIDVFYGFRFGSQKTPGISPRWALCEKLAIPLAVAINGESTMKLYGYVKDSEAESPQSLGEVTIATNPDTLRRLCRIPLRTADMMERHGSLFGHEHFHRRIATSRSSSCEDKPQPT